MKTIAQMKDAEKLIKELFNLGCSYYRIVNAFMETQGLTFEQAEIRINQLIVNQKRTPEASITELATLYGLVETVILESNIPFFNQNEITQYEYKHGV